MPHASQSELPELLHWLTEIIQPVQSQQWQITLNSSGGVVSVMAKVVQSHKDDGRGNTMTIERVSNAKFRLAQVPGKRTVFRIE